MLASRGRLGRRLAQAAAFAAGAAVTTASVSRAESLLPKALLDEAEEDVVVENWSSTHTASPLVYFSPD